MDIGDELEAVVLLKSGCDHVCDWQEATSGSPRVESIEGSGDSSVHTPLIKSQVGGVFALQSGQVGLNDLQARDCWWVGTASGRVVEDGERLRRRLALRGLELTVATKMTAMEIRDFEDPTIGMNNEKKSATNPLYFAWMYNRLIEHVIAAD